MCQVLINAVIVQVKSAHSLIVRLPDYTSKWTWVPATFPRAANSRLEAQLDSGQAG
jgi:hypothetical protein